MVLNVINREVCLCSCVSRECCLLPLQMALESKNTKLGQTALCGMQVCGNLCHFLL